MKNRVQNLKNWIFVFTLLTSGLITETAIAETHYDYLTIVIDQPHDTQEQQIIHYPQGTTFELLSKAGKTFATSKDDRKNHTYWGNFSLVIYPSYHTDQPEKIKIKQQRVRIFTDAATAKAAGFADEMPAELEKEQLPKISEVRENEQKSYQPYTSNGVSLSRSVFTPSSVNEKESNVELIFSDGVVFKYIDGKATATRADKSLEITNRYLIKSEFGITKVSYNPKTREIWWVYEPTSL